MKMKINNQPLLMALLGILMYSCQKDFAYEITPPQEWKINNITELGEKLENPFSLENMQRALDTIMNEIKKSKDEELYSFNKLMKEIEIKPTDLYVRFLPRDSVELELLKEDTSLVFYEYPLDYKFEEQLEYNIASNLSYGSIAWQYTVVKPDYNFPNIEYEILSHLFIPSNSNGYVEEEDIDFQERSIYLKSHFLDKLETVSLYLTKNLPEEEYEQIKKVKSSRPKSKWYMDWSKSRRWNPSGRVRIEDTELGWRPVEGVKVRARRWFTTKTGVTDANGYFSLGSFKRPVNYSLIWETYQFSIREKWGLSLSRQAKINGPKMNQDWNVDLISHTKHWFQGTIFQAAHHYYYLNNKGLKRPPTNSFWKPQMKIRAHFEVDSIRNGKHCKGCRLFGTFARIRIYNPQRSSVEIYASTIHELAHASHWELRKNNWSDYHLSPKVKESWAEGVQWELTRMKYPDYQGIFWNTNQSDNTLVVIDMIDLDGFNTTNHGFFDSRDQVSGYTIQQIEELLPISSSWIVWRDNIISSYSNPTENYLEKLFKSYE